VLLLGATLAAQAVPNRAAAYLHPTDVADARAIWVNPAGLAGITAASVYLDLTTDHPGSRGTLGQVSLGFDSHGLGFSYQRDAFGGGARSHAYKVGLASGNGVLAAGFDLALNGGDSHGTAWDVGLTYRPNTMLRVGGAVLNIGEPTVLGVKTPVTFVPGVTIEPPGLAGRGALSAHARVTTSAVQGYALGVRIAFGRVGTLARIDTERGLRRTGFAFGLSIGGQDLVGAVATTPGDLSTVDRASLYGVSTRHQAAGR
jgi:hypothetical protein